MRVFQCARGNAVMQFTSLDQARHYIGKGGVDFRPIRTGILRMAETHWILDRQKFMRRITAFITVFYTIAMILMFRVFDPLYFAAWILFLVMGLLVGYLATLMMWHLYVVPRMSTAGEVVGQPPVAPQSDKRADE
jgi:hypothetical protein